MTDWWQILAVIAIAAAAVWLWRRTGRPRRSSCCDSDSSPSANSCANCPLTTHCPHNNQPKATLR